MSLTESENRDRIGHWKGWLVHNPEVRIGLDSIWSKVVHTVHKVAGNSKRVAGRMNLAEDDEE